RGVTVVRIVGMNVKNRLDQTHIPLPLSATAIVFPDGPAESRLDLNPAGFRPQREERVQAITAYDARASVFSGPGGDRLSGSCDRTRHRWSCTRPVRDRPIAPRFPHGQPVYSRT